ncbi:MAG: Rrf2 family transcriptional regulator [Candidatus Margulisbacteria bacterium]|nr:Rrf2 family transcriptional regulator [Candidatus Margulisiibacteriota bacterium]
MKMPIRTIYGLQALFEIALHSNIEGVPSSDIAEAQKIPVKFLEQILSSLKKEKLVRSYRGRKGGYILGRLPKDISLLDVIEALEGPVLLTGGGRAENTVRQMLKVIESKLIEELRSVNFEELIKEKIKKEKISLYSI